MRKIVALLIAIAVVLMSSGCIDSDNATEDTDNGESDAIGNQDETFNGTDNGQIDIIDDTNTSVNQ